MVRTRRWRRTVPRKVGDLLIVKDGVNGRGLVPRPRPLGLLLVLLLVRPLLLPDAFHLALLKSFKGIKDTALGVEVNEVEPQCSAPFVTIAQGDHEVGYVRGDRHRLVGEQRGNVGDQLRLVFTGESVAVERVTSREEVGGL